MKWCILGIDGYLGWSLACHLAEAGHTVCGIDIFLRRAYVKRMRSRSAIPIAEMSGRVEAFRAAFPGHNHGNLRVEPIDVRSYEKLRGFLASEKPDAIVHLAEQPSAPFSMIDHEPGFRTLQTNLEGTYNVVFAMREVCPEAHLIKLGTMGEYGTPGIPIPEGVFPGDSLWMEGTPEGEQIAGAEPVWPAFMGRLAGMQFPRCPGSLYHATKVMDTVLVEFACRMWGLTSTDIMQGVVYGTRIPAHRGDADLRTRFDVDECFGTAINRFVAQALIGESITPYGKGHQKRGFLPLADSMQCIALLAENPPFPGTYRTVNQIEAVYDITELAWKVHEAALRLGISAPVQNWTNPRKEQEDHEYEVQADTLRGLGYQPTTDMDAVLDDMLADLQPHTERIASLREVILPRTRWDAIGPSEDALGPLESTEAAG